MRKMKSSFISSAVLSGILVLSGCSMDGLSSGSSSDIDHVGIDLPKQIEWTQAKDQKIGPTGRLQEWVIKGFKPNSTPARIISQKISPAIPTNELLAKVIQPFKSECADIKVTPIPLTSKHADKVSNEVICSKLGKNPVGLIVYTSVFSDKTANHLVIGEVRIPPSKKAGELDIKNEKQRRQAQTSQAVAQLMQQMTVNLKACDASNKCQ